MLSLAYSTSSYRVSVVGLWICTFCLNHSVGVGAIASGQTDTTVSAIFARAYAMSVHAHTDTSITLVSGKTFSTTTHALYGDYETQLDNATLADMIAVPYLPGPLQDIPSKNHDPGRARHTAFFDAMYGHTLKTVRRTSTTVQWVDGTLLTCTTINGVHRHLQSIVHELMRLPTKYRQFLDRPGGTLVWREIAGTQRRSAHCYGIAIDINVSNSHYWRNAAASIKGQPPVYKNKIPQQIVDVFERHGFIWGGKWYHYDTMHFEFRPELCLPKCSCISSGSIPQRR